MLVATETDMELGGAVDRTLRYYALFAYPLQLAEVCRNCELNCAEQEILEHLNAQLLLGQVFHHAGYYSTSPDVIAQVDRRISGNEKAVKDIRHARRIGSLIFQFPFIRFVGISGSLSKGYSDDRTDFDFFIVTAKNRLWISRTLLHLFKKLTFLFGQQHKFCMNYFLDESALSLEERNIYTATELSSLIPVCGPATYAQLLLANDWVRRFLPNARHDKVGTGPESSSVIKRLLSALINAVNPEGLNRFLMRLTDSRWRRKWARKGYPAEDYNLAFKTTLHISKNHPANYQKRILEALTPKST